jgi:hypothetical protein
MDDRNACGTCSLCCKLLGIEEIEKSPGVWCRYCTPGTGCTIHEQNTYPTDCRAYVCLWRQKKDEGHSLPDDLRPDRCKVIIDAAKHERIHYVRCEPAFAGAWRNPKIIGILAQLERHGSTVYLITSNKIKKLLIG